MRGDSHWQLMVVWVRRGWRTADMLVRYPMPMATLGYLGTWLALSRLRGSICWLSVRVTVIATHGSPVTDHLPHSMFHVPRSSIHGRRATGRRRRFVARGFATMMRWSGTRDRGRMESPRNKEARADDSKRLNRDQMLDARYQRTQTLKSD